jgi:hypothetical protein
MTRPAPRLPYAVAFGALTVEVAAHLLDFGLDDLRARVFDASQEWSWSHVVATAAFASGVAVSVFAARRRCSGSARHWWVLALLFGVLLADNVTRAHEAVALWPLIVLPALAGVAIATTRLARGTPAFRPALLALALLAASLIIHVLGHALVHEAGWGSATWGYQIKVALKEGTELAGWLLLVPVLARLARGATRGPHNGWGAPGRGPSADEGVIGVARTADRSRAAPLPLWAR